MANRTDPLANVVSGTDPQNLLEYITRQKIYDGRYWKETCFGLAVADVLEVGVEQLHCVGGIPTRFLALLLKLLQLYPDADLVIESFIQQEDFKYIRALGCLYLRMTAQPAVIYQTLEPLYSDKRKLRCWTTATQEWSILHMDEFIHQLLNPYDSHMMSLSTTATTARTLGIALPRLVSREALQEAGYLEEGPRETALEKYLAEYGNNPVEYLRYKCQTSFAAREAWKRRKVRLGEKGDSVKPTESKKPERTSEDVLESTSEKKQKKRKDPSRKYGSLFKKGTPTASESNEKQDQNSSSAVEEHSEEYWNAERRKLGLEPLR